MIAKRAEDFTPLSEDEYVIDFNTYELNSLDGIQEEDGLTPEEAAFMHGYLAA